MPIAPVTAGMQGLVLVPMARDVSGGRSDEKKEQVLLMFVCNCK